MNGKYKPALFELIEKGQLKPNRSGAMSTPDWFYTGKKKKKTETPESNDSEANNAFKSPRLKLRMPDFTARMKEKRLEISTNFWIVSLVGLALVLTHLTSFMLGKRGTVEPVAGNPTSLSAAMDIPAGKSVPANKVIDRSELAGIRQSPVRQNIYPQRRKAAPAAKKTTATASPTRRTVADVAKSQTLAVATKTAVTRGGDMCLIMCGHPDSIRALRPVQEYFNKKGIPVEIGRFQGRYIVYTRQNFAKQSGADAVRLKEEIGRAGMEYNHNKPKGALGFGAETFAGAFAVNKNRIKNIDN